MVDLVRILIMFITKVLGLQKQEQLCVGINYPYAWKLL
jgi:hypothetical protein